MTAPFTTNSTMNQSNCLFVRYRTLVFYFSLFFTNGCTVPRATRGRNTITISTKSGFLYQCSHQSDMCRFFRHGNQVVNFELHQQVTNRLFLNSENSIWRKWKYSVRRNRLMVHQYPLNLWILHWIINCGFIHQVAIIWISTIIGNQMVYTWDSLCLFAYSTL